MGYTPSNILSVYQWHECCNVTTTFGYTTAYQVVSGGDISTSAPHCRATIAIGQGTLLLQRTNWWQMRDLATATIYITAVPFVKWERFHAI